MSVQYADWAGKKVRITDTLEMERDSTNTVAMFEVDSFGHGVGWYSVLSQTASNMPDDVAEAWKEDMITTAQWILEETP